MGEVTEQVRHILGTPHIMSWNGHILASVLLWSNKISPKHSSLKQQIFVISSLFCGCSRMALALDLL